MTNIGLKTMIFDLAMSAGTSLSPGQVARVLDSHHLASSLVTGHRHINISFILIIVVPFPLEFIPNFSIASTFHNIDFAEWLLPERRSHLSIPLLRYDRRKSYVRGILLHNTMRAKVFCGKLSPSRNQTKLK